MKLVNLLYFSLINSHDDQNLIEKVFFKNDVICKVVSHTRLNILKHRLLLLWTHLRLSKLAKSRKH